MRKKILIVTAHPDDETLWFSSIILRNDCDVVCVTCGDGKVIAKKRRDELTAAARLLGVKNISVLNYRDKFLHRLDVKQLERDLKKFRHKQYEAIYTHSPFGDTNEHLHHQDISYVVHKVFPRVKSIAWNIYPDEIYTLRPEEFTLKKYIMGTVYHREYKRLKTSYEVSSVEKFVELSRESVEIYYWAIANFGDRHQLLGRKYENIWGYDLSPYEIERHAGILTLLEKTATKSLLEIGASEGILTEKLAEKVKKLDCVETAPVYVSKLKTKGYRVVEKYDTEKYDTVLVASVLEYMEKPVSFLSGLKSQYVIVEVINTSYMKSVAYTLRKRYKMYAKILILPRWEKMYRQGKKEKMEVYKLGAQIFLFGPNK